MIIADLISFNIQV